MEPDDEGDWETVTHHKKKMKKNDEKIVHQISFQWDKDKDEKNFNKHGIRFISVTECFNWRKSSW